MLSEGMLNKSFSLISVIIRRLSTEIIIKKMYLTHKLRISVSLSQNTSETGAKSNSS